MLIGPAIERRSNAKNAYDLMTDIKEYILEEPKRVWMGGWIIKGHANIEDMFEVKGPACGTVGCIAGNAVLLTGTNTNHGIAGPALRILGGPNYELQHSLEFDLFLNTGVDANYGTMRYARIVAKRIEKFQKQHETELRAVKVAAIKQKDKGK